MKNKANKMKLVHESDYRVMQRQGFWLPFLILIAGCYFLIDILLYNPDNLQHVKGKLVDYQKKDHLYLKVDAYEFKFVLVGHKRKEKIEPFLKKGNLIELWALPEKNDIVQIIINDKLLIKRQTKGEMLIFPLIIIGISLIIIPFVIKARRKNAEYFGDDKLFGKKKFKR